MAEKEQAVPSSPDDERTARYARILGRMIRCETVSSVSGVGVEKFRSFRLLLPSLFPRLFSICEYTEFTDGFALRWPGRDPEAKPVLFMNHHDVVEAGGEFCSGKNDLVLLRLHGRNDRCRSGRGLPLV